MHCDSDQVRHLLKTSNFKSLFVEQLGWDHHSATIEAVVNGQAYKLAAIAQKRGVVVFVHEGAIPDDQTRRKIDRIVAKSVHQHFIIFLDTGRTEQVWQWVRREPGKPLVFRQHTFHSNQSGESLIQKLKAITFSLKEEEDLHHVDVTGRVRAAFDTERVTKRFYDRFKSEHEKFLDFIKGIPDDGLQHWYAAVMLNRLMFIYFVQKKEFLDNDINYLRTKLGQSKQRGKDRFYTGFLCPLFFDGFAKKESERSTATSELLGKVPYLNGGLFLRHQVEELHGASIRIGDAAFERIFAFFEEFHWHLDERPNRNDREINPDVLGYIFEKYINQKQMGAYYTKEDITGYISQNTIIPFLFDAARQKCKVAFEGDHSVWRLLQAEPDRYIYDAVKHGITIDLGEKPPCRIVEPPTLPPEIAWGIHDVSKRTEWNKSAPKDYALPTEIWREVIVRRKRYEDVRAKLASGDIQSINDLITYNLDIRQFAQDVIEQCEGPDLLRAFWHAIQEVTALDPTCGSGAFLFAALNVLEPLYEACLNRMEVFLDELDRSGKKHRPEKFDDFRKALDRVAKHASPRSFIYKSIIVNNLYGVDIMEEAVEICKLRLFLKMVAQVDRVEQIEPLPDIDFNIRTGNTLVGYATLDDLKKSMEGDWVKLQHLPKIEENAEIADRAFQKFHEMQTKHGMQSEDFKDAKQEVRKRLAALEKQLNEYLAEQYGVDHRKADKYNAWLDSHKPFHWFIEFYGIMKKGGFDVIISNPPYVELSDIIGQYTVKETNLSQTGNLFSLCAERFAQILIRAGGFGIIVPVSAVSTPRMLPLVQMLVTIFSTFHTSNFSVRPGKLFVGVDMNLTIMIGQKGWGKAAQHVFSTGYNRWKAEFRPFLFQSLLYAESCLKEDASTILKIGSPIENAIAQKVFRHDYLKRYRSERYDAKQIFYHSGGRYFRKCIRKQLSNEYKELRVQKSWDGAIICLLSSSLYYWFWITVSDCYHVTKRDIDSLPTSESLGQEKTLHGLAERLNDDLWANAEKRVRNRADGSRQIEVNFYVGKSKHIIDKIDRVLAKHYGFTDEELDFIINYDIKYRMGQDVEESGDS